MAGRPHKQGLEYFSFDTDFFDNEKIEELMEDHSAIGVIFFQQLLCRIYKSGNYLEWSASNRRSFTKKYGYTADQVEKYLTAILGLDLLHLGLFKRYNVLTSDSIQERYLYSVKRRERVMYVEQYLLINLLSFKTRPEQIEIWNVDGELVHYIVKEKDNTKQKPGKEKPKREKKDTAIAVPESEEPKPPPPDPEPDVDQLPVVPDEPKEPVRYLPTQEVKAFISVPYDSRDSEIKENYTKELYNEFVLFNKMIDSKFDNIRRSTRQLSIYAYKEFKAEFKPTDKEINGALKRMSGGSISVNQDVYSRLSICLDQERTPFNSSNNTRQPATPVVTTMRRFSDS
jgi:hypothetical protein